MSNFVTCLCTVILAVALIVAAALHRQQCPCPPSLPNDTRPIAPPPPSGRLEWRRQSDATYLLFEGSQLRGYYQPPTRRYFPWIDGRGWGDATNPPIGLPLPVGQTGATAKPTDEP